MAAPRVSSIEDVQRALDELYAATRRREFGPLSTGVSPAIAPDGEWSSVVRHGLALAGDPDELIVRACELRDGFYAGQATWRVGAKTADTIEIVIGNPSGHASVQAELVFTVGVPG